MLGGRTGEVSSRGPICPVEVLRGKARDGQRRQEETDDAPYHSDVAV
jgi:hypothetical protein